MREFTTKSSFIRWLNNNQNVEIEDIVTIKNKLRVFFKAVE